MNFTQFYMCILHKIHKKKSSRPHWHGGTWEFRW